MINLVLAFFLAAVPSGLFVAPGAPSGCSRCGCQAGHCGAGIPSHFGCSSATPQDRRRVQERVDKLKQVAKKHTDPSIKHCNHLVQKVAQDMGYSGFKGLTADKMLEHLAGSEEKVKQAVQDGWSFLSPDSTPQNVKPMTVDEAMQYANAGRLVVAMVHSQLRNAVKPAGDNNGRAYANGHVFVILPGGKSGDGWRGCPVLNAGSGADPSARQTTANMVTKEWERPIVTFWALQK